MTLIYLGPTIGTGDLIVPAATLDPLLARADWYIDAAEQRVAGVTDLAGSADLSAIADTPDLRPVGPTDWSGDALVGFMRLDSGYDDGLSWPTTGLDVSATFSVQPINAPGAGGWAEIFSIPTVDDEGVTEYLEFAVVFDLSGDDVWIGLDFESGGETGGPTFVFDEPIGTKGEGVAEHTWRLTGVFATGVLTLYRDGVQFTQQTFEAFTLPEPAAGVPVQVGPFQYLTPLKDASLKDNIGGAEIIGWDADNTTGWSFESSGGISSPLAASGWIGGGSMGWNATDPAVFALGAEESATWAFTGRILDPAQAISPFKQFAGVPGWRFNHAPAGPLTFQVSSGGAPVSAPFAASDTDDHVWVVVLDRVADTLTSYTDGVEDTEADASALGAVDSTAGLAWLTNYTVGYRAAFWREARTDIAAITASMGV